jgi:hypothetical protein
MGALEFRITTAQRLILGVGNSRRVIRMIAPVMLGDLGAETGVLFLGFGKAEGGDGRRGAGHDGILA